MLHHSGAKRVIPNKPFCTAFSIPPLCMALIPVIFAAIKTTVLLSHCPSLIHILQYFLHPFGLFTALLLLHQRPCLRILSAFTSCRCSETLQVSTQLSTCVSRVNMQFFYLGA